MTANIQNPTKTAATDTSTADSLKAEALRQEIEARIKQQRKPPVGIDAPVVVVDGPQNVASGEGQVTCIEEQGNAGA